MGLRETQHMFRGPILTSRVVLEGRRSDSHCRRPGTLTRHLARPDVRIVLSLRFSAARNCPYTCETNENTLWRSKLHGLLCGIKEEGEQLRLLGIGSDRPRQPLGIEWDVKRKLHIFPTQHYSYVPQAFRNLATL